MRRREKWLNRALSLIALMVVTVALVLVGRWHKLTSAEWAGWVQALGGIAAVAAAIWISLDSTRQAARAKREENSALDRNVRRIAERAKLLAAQIESGEVWKELQHQCEREHLRNVYIAQMSRTAQEIHAVLAAFTVDRLASIHLVDSAIFIRRAMSEIEAQLPYFEFDGAGKPVGPAKLQLAAVRHMIEDGFQAMPATLL